MKTLNFTATIGRVFALAAVAALTACSSGVDLPSDTPEPVPPLAEGALEVIHASQDAPNVDVLVEGNLAAGDLAFGEAAFTTTFVGDRSISVEGILPGGNATVIPPATITIAEEDRVTVIAAGDVASIGPIVLTDTPPAVDAAEVRVRVLHAASNAPQVEVYITEPGTDITTVASAGIFSFGELLTPDALVVPAGPYQIQVTIPLPTLDQAERLSL
jgi:hypothetical protein